MALGGRGGHFPRQLSLGQQRRLALARAYAACPQLLLLDEPFVSLDAELVEDMLELTETLIRDIRPITLFVTHDLREAERLADRILLSPRRIADKRGQGIRLRGPACPRRSGMPQQGRSRLAGGTVAD